MGTGTRIRIPRAFLAAVAGVVFSFSAQAATADPELEIDHIEFSGVTALGEVSIRGALEIAPGDRLDRTRVAKSRENLEALYKKSGYPQATIRPRFSKNILEFAVSEGKPTRIAEIRFVQEGLRGEASRKAWEQLKPSLQSRIPISPRDLLNQDQVAVARRTILDYLATREYIGAKIEDARVIAQPIPAEPKSDWVALEFVIRPGDRVSFGFRGNQVFNLQRLLALVDEQRLIGFGKDYIGATRTRIEEEYKTLGFARVHIEALTFEKPESLERRVTYVIDEGPRVRIQEVHFDGNQAFADEDLRKQFFSKASTIVQHGYYSEKDVQKAAELVIEWMKSHGYLSSKLVTINTTYIPGWRAGERDMSVRLTVYVYEWDQTIVQSIAIKGATALTQAEIKSTLGIQEGAPLNLFAFSEGMEVLKSQFRAKGHLGVRVLNEGTDEVVHYSSENRYADVTLEIDEGPRYRVSRILVEGLTQTREHIVRRELQFTEGDVLEENRITESEAKLRRMGIFAAVALRVTDDPEKKGHKIVRLSIQEGTPGVIGGGVGLRNDLGVRVFGGVSYGNIGGRNQAAALDIVANRRLQDLPRPGGKFERMNEYDLRLSYHWPWLLMNEDSFRPSMAITRAQYIFFDAETVSATAMWEKQIISKPKTRLRLKYSLEKVRQYHAVDKSGDEAPPDNQQLVLGSVTPELQVDLRDNPLAPTSGLFFVSSLEYSAPWLLSNGTPAQSEESFRIGYTRFQVRTDYFLPVIPNVTWYFSFRAGLARNIEPVTIDPLTGQPILGSGAIPLVKQFALGGAGSLRGFKEQELNSQDLSIRGTQSYVNYRSQLDVPISGALRFGPFLDAANLQVDTFSFGNLRLGAGLGFHYQTPVGPMNLDFGWKLNRHPDELDIYNVYFSIGVI